MVWGLEARGFQGQDGGVGGWGDRTDMYRVNWRGLCVSAGMFYALRLGNFKDIAQVHDHLFLFLSSTVTLYFQPIYISPRIFLFLPFSSRMIFTRFSTVAKATDSGIHFLFSQE
jgi:hypothetical protein